METLTVCEGGLEKSRPSDSQTSPPALFFFFSQSHPFQQDLMRKVLVSGAPPSADLSVFLRPRMEKFHKGSKTRTQNPEVHPEPLPSGDDHEVSPSFRLLDTPKTQQKGRMRTLQTCIPQLQK